jgi:hypothetical protein
MDLWIKPVLTFGVAALAGYVVYVGRRRPEALKWALATLEALLAWALATG